MNTFIKAIMMFFLAIAGGGVAHSFFIDPPSAFSVPPTAESKNYEKAKQLLPGEEVVTPTGQKIKVWSTVGSVPVEKASEPFEEEGPAMNELDVEIDASDSLRKHDRPSRRKNHHQDSFDFEGSR